LRRWKSGGRESSASTAITRFNRHSSNHGRCAYLGDTTIHGDDQPVQFTGVLGCEWHRGREFDHGHDQFLRALQSASLAAERPGDGSSQLSGRPVQGCGRERGGSGSHTSGDIRRDRGCYRGFGKHGAEQVAYGSFDSSVVGAAG